MAIDFSKQKPNQERNNKMDNETEYEKSERLKKLNSAEGILNLFFSMFWPCLIIFMAWFLIWGLWDWLGEMGEL